jgi:hypothetical protein
MSQLTDKENDGKVTELHRLLNELGVDKASIVVGTEGYEYVRLSLYEFQFYRLADAPHTAPSS